MRYRLAQDARPQALTLLIAATISVVLWFIPYAEFLTYPFQIFVTSYMKADTRSRHC
jgi:hypothetical protein